MPTCTCATCHVTFPFLSAFDMPRDDAVGKSTYAESRIGKSAGSVIGHTPGALRCLIEPEVLAPYSLSLKRSGIQATRAGGVWSALFARSNVIGQVTGDLSYWCASPRRTVSLFTLHSWTRLESGARGTGHAPLRAGERSQAPPCRYPTDVSGPWAPPLKSVSNDSR